MARRLRICLADIPSHAYARGHSHQDIFGGEADRMLLWDCLLEASRRFQVAVHAYVFMSNHIHLLATPAAPDGLARLFQHVGRRYVRQFNKRHGRSGTLWEGRFHSQLVETERYYFNVHRYIECNPVRAGIVGDPSDFRWSSHVHYAGLGVDSLVTSHGALVERITGPLEFRRMFTEALPDSVVNEIREARRNRAPLGGPEFIALVEGSSGRQAMARRRGPPKMSGEARAAESGQELLL